MSDSSRREFLAASAVAAALPTFAVHADTTPKEPAAKPPALRLGIIGPGGQGTGLLNSFVRMEDVRIEWVCDVDAGRLAQAVSKVKAAANYEPKPDVDMRRVLDDKSVDAVVIATPDHWHAPATILACDAGKHVYVEKPASHNLREGRLMIEAARRNKRVVQLGTQSRSVPAIQNAIDRIQEGAIGEVLVAKAWNSQIRRNIGKHQASEVPDGLDYDKWVGPAPMVPYQKNLLHSIWRWWHAFGTGDMGNDGVHDIDIARWGLGVTTHPTSIAAMGGKYFFDDDQQFPDTMTVAFEYPGASKAGRPKQLIYEQRIWSPYVQEGHENGCAWYGTRGMLILGKQNGWVLYKSKNEKVMEMPTDFTSAHHHRNFIDCIRNGRTPNADIEIGHLSSSLCHLGNIAIRVGRSLKFDPKTEQIVGDEEAAKLLTRKYREGHWAAPTS